MMKTETYHEILQIFTESALNDWMKKPFWAKGHICATNGRALVAVPPWGRECENYENKDSKVIGVYPTSPNRQTRMPLSLFKDALSKVPLVDCFDEEEKRCDECDGEGEVEYTYQYGRKDFGLLGTCPCCDGDGVFMTKSEVANGKKEPDYSKYIKLGDVGFYVARIVELINVADLMEASEIILLRMADPYSPVLFSIGEVELLLCPAVIQEGHQSDISAFIDIDALIEEVNP